MFKINAVGDQMELIVPGRGSGIAVADGNTRHDYMNCICVRTRAVV